MKKASELINEASELIHELHVRGLSNQAIANAIGASRTTISQIANGKQSGRNILPKLQKLTDLRIREGYYSSIPGRHHDNPIIVDPRRGYPSRDVDVFPLPPPPPPPPHTFIQRVQRVGENIKDMVQDYIHMQGRIERAKQTSTQKIVQELSKGNRDYYVAEQLGTSPGTLERIKSGKTSGKKYAARLRKMYLEQVEEILADD